MGKKQHSKDRMYLTTKEWKHEWGGFKDKTRIPFAKLPFHCCGIAFTPFEDSVCTEDGTVFDVINIVPYIMKFKKHPVSGQPLALKDLIKLNWHKNAEGQYDCPVTGKVFTEHTHIVALRTSGNVYAFESVEELCIKPKSWKDLVTDEPFTRKDIIHIQDPLNLAGRALEQFDHVQQGLTLDEVEGPISSVRNMSEDLKRALGSLQSTEAKAAFEGGGGGRRAEALRLLAAAHSVATAKAGKEKERDKQDKDEAKAGTSITPTAPAPTPAAASEGGDWRLRAPEGRELPRYRPGASTWDTEDYTTAAGKALKKKEEKMAAMVAEAGSTAPREGAKRAGPGKMGGLTPAERYEADGHVKQIESFRNTAGMATSFTSTSAPLQTKATRQLVRLDRNPGKKGYMRLHTTLGDLNLEIHCDVAPRTCENFFALSAMGYYEGTIFHRSIKNFMIQGGDPTGTGLGGESIYGKTFRDECDGRLSHSGRGMLSMANSGKDTNGSQFFITYKSCKHLDYKHTVFGTVVGGLEVITAMERTPTDAEDRPQQEIKITGVTVFTNPYQIMEDEEKAEKLRKQKESDKAEGLASKTGEYKVGKWFTAPGGGDLGSAPEGLQGAGTAGNMPGFREGGVGKYLKGPTAGVGPAQTDAQPPAAGHEPGSMPPPAKKARQAPNKQLTNFDAW